MAETGTTKCPSCGFENELTARHCANAACLSYLKSDLECLRSIDKPKPETEYLRSIDLSLMTIKRIAIWWLILSILAVLACVVYYIDKH